MWLTCSHPLSNFSHLILSRKFTPKLYIRFRVFFWIHENAYFFWLLHGIFLDLYLFRKLLMIANFSIFDCSDWKTNLMWNKEKHTICVWMMFDFTQKVRISSTWDENSAWRVKLTKVASTCRYWTPLDKLIFQEFSKFLSTFRRRVRNQKSMKPNQFVHNC